MGPRTGERVDEQRGPGSGWAHDERVGVQHALTSARVLATEPRSLDSAIGALEELTRSLQPSFDGRADGDGTRPLEPVRTVLSTHLVAVRVLRDVEASDTAVTKLVLRAIDGAEELVHHVG